MAESCALVNSELDRSPGKQKRRSSTDGKVRQDQASLRKAKKAMAERFGVRCALRVPRTSEKSPCAVLVGCRATHLWGCDVKPFAVATLSCRRRPLLSEPAPDNHRFGIGRRPPQTFARLYSAFIQASRSSSIRSGIANAVGLAGP